MDKQELIAFLKENLSVEVDCRERDGKVEVTLKLCGETISNSYDYVIGRDEVRDMCDDRHA